MRCPKCRENINGDDRICPRCGEPVGERPAGVLKTSTILISADHTDKVYRSVGEVPEPLRKTLLRSTNSILSRTILIADRRGSQEIERALRNLPGASKQQILNSGLRGKVPAGLRRLAIAQTVGILLTLAAGLVVWLMLSH